MEVRLNLTREEFHQIQKGDLIRFSEFENHIFKVTSLGICMFTAQKIERENPDNIYFYLKEHDLISWYIKMAAPEKEILQTRLSLIRTRAS